MENKPIYNNENSAKLSTLVADAGREYLNKGFVGHPNPNPALEHKRAFLFYALEFIIDYEKTKPGIGYLDKAITALKAGTFEAFIKEQLAHDTYFPKSDDIIPKF